MSSLPEILCIIEAKHKDTQIKEGVDLISKIKEVLPGLIISSNFGITNNDIILMTSKSMYKKISAIDAAVETILQQHGYTNKKG